MTLNPARFDYPTRSVPCANCGARHENTALCDDCAAIVALPCPHDAFGGVEGCDCTSCRVAGRACGALAEALSDLNVYSLPEVRSARAELAATPNVALPHEAAFEPMPEVNDADLAHDYVDGCECEHCDSHRAMLDTLADEAFAAFVVDLDGMVTDLETGEVIGHVPPAALRAEVA